MYKVREALVFCLTDLRISGKNEKDVETLKTLQTKYTKQSSGFTNFNTELQTDYL